MHSQSLMGGGHMPLCCHLVGSGSLIIIPTYTIALKCIYDSFMSRFLCINHD